MTKEKLINHTIKTLTNLPQEKVKEIYDYADFLLKKHDEELMQNGIKSLISKSKAYDFLNKEENLYTVEDLKERY